MSLLRNQRGFTFTEIIIAISIMALGFLAMAQMQYLSLRQKQRAEQGTVATNVIQFIADRDMEEVKRAHILNSIAFVEAQAGRLNAGSSSEPHLQYCMSGNPDRMCDMCPCDPLAEVTPNPAAPTITSCAVVDPYSFDPGEVSFSREAPICTAAADSESMIVVKRVGSVTDNTRQPPITTLTVTYAVKTKSQFADTGFQSLSIKDTLATQNLVFSAHREDWSQFIPAWSNVNVPHVP
ncbi:MAG TPA: prepilin-type N-terminal cleavage/methylation domain-containing protein [Thermodesulfobacteriota bacterium]|nr:prepilin-type N-terminal cleavage/methylation domain-containing protein [Thermodesulfobacteriota bacterium]